MPAELPPPTQMIELGADPLMALPSGAAHRLELCGRGYDDLLQELQCDGSLDSITSILELSRLLQLDPTVGSTVDSTYASVVLTAHSTALSLRTVSSVNPRAVFVRHDDPAAGGELLAMAFTRGEQAVEFVVRDRGSQQLRFYLLSYRQACNERQAGCLPGDLLTTETEHGWRDLDLYADEDLANTPVDCLHCHQPQGPGSETLLRMQEMTLPWTHWLWRHGHGGSVLMDDYYRAKGDEPYAGVPWEVIQQTEPGALPAFLRRHGAPPQPNPFDSATIEQEVHDGVEQQPGDNSIPGDSPTWRDLYDKAMDGSHIAVPYHDVKITDPQKLALMTEAYVRYRAGELPAEELPDLRDVLPDDPQLLAEMGMQPDPALEGHALLRAACGRCHNANLDQSLSRAAFDVEGSLEDGKARDKAVERLMRPIDEAGAMPPPRLQLLTDAQRQELIEWLSE